MNIKLIYCAIGIVLFLQTQTVFSSSPRDGSNSQAQALIQQLGAERTRLNAENAKLKSQIKTLEQELEKATSENEQMTSQLGSTEKQLSNKAALSDALRERLENAKLKMEELIAKFRETIANLRTVEDENEQRRQTIARLEKQLNTCATNNVELSKLGFELLDSYQSKGFWDRAGQKEPFTQIKRVRIENLVDDYTYMIEDQQYTLPEKTE